MKAAESREIQLKNTTPPPEQLQRRPGSRRHFHQLLRGCRPGVPQFLADRSTMMLAPFVPKQVQEDPLQYLQKSTPGSTKSKSGLLVK